MKSLRFYAAALSLLFTFVSCEEEPQKVEPEVKTPEIRVGEASVSLDSDGAVRISGTDIILHIFGLSSKRIVHMAVHHLVHLKDVVF